MLINLLMDLLQFWSLVGLLLYFILRAEKDWKKWAAKAVPTTKRATERAVALVKAKPVKA